jgi:hypothetical protein
MSKQSKPEEKQQSQKLDDKNKKELSWGEKLADQIAGDNEMLKGAIKFLAHPLVLCTGGILILFWLFKGDEQKKLIEKLQRENEKLNEAVKGIEKEILELKAEQKNIQLKLPEAPKENTPLLGTGYRQKNLSSPRRYTNAYLD